jgi:hypothetical protein
MPQITGDYKKALDRLIAIARRDTGQSKKVADFLLSCWNASECGGWDITDAWAVDAEIKKDMITVLVSSSTTTAATPTRLDIAGSFSTSSATGGDNFSIKRSGQFSKSAKRPPMLRRLMFSALPRSVPWHLLRTTTIDCRRNSEMNLRRGIG